MQLNDGSLLIGFIIGFFVAGIMSWMLRNIEKARRDMGAPDRSMVVPTAKTPRQVFTAAADASRTCFAWTLALAGFVMLVIVVILWFTGFI